MNELHIDTNEREHREQREQTSHHVISECSRESGALENNGNNLMDEIINPILVPPLEYPKPKINRPGFHSHHDWFELQGRQMKPGVYWHGKRHKNGKSIDVDEWICSPISVEGITSSTLHDNLGRLLRLQDTHGQWHEWAMPMHLLKGNGDELRGELLNRGVIFYPKKRNDIINYIMTQNPKRKIMGVDRVGWHGNAFVLPNQVIGEEDVVFQSEATAEGEFHTQGGLSGWQQDIGKLCEGNIPLMVSICAALTGPLLRFVDRQQGGGIHWVGDSSSGKSTAVEIAASVWGSPEFIRSWSATANGLEGVAAARNDTCLILDEIDEASAHEVGKIAYMLANGQGKQRAGRIGIARTIQRWRIITISTGERTLTSIMNEIGKRPNAGQLVRLLSIPVSFEHGAFSELHGFENGRTLADHLKAMRLKHYGHVGPAFIQCLMAEKRDLRVIFDLIMKLFAAEAKTNIELRAATLFAVISLAGELAIEYGILPWKLDSAVEAALIAFKRFKAFQGPGQTEDTIILQGVSNFIAKHGDSRFSMLNENDEDKTIYNRAGWYKKVGDERVYLFFPVALVEAGVGFERTRITDALRRAKWIAEHDAGRWTKKVRTSAGFKNLYHVWEPVEND